MSGPGLAWFCFVTACAHLLGAAAADAEDVLLARGGQTEWGMFVPAGAGPVERFASDELRRYLEQICDARLDDRSQADRPMTIRMGLRSALGEGLGLPPAKPGYDGYSIAVTRQAVTIAGDNPRGVLYGVYDLLERLGCRWYQPTLDPKDPESVPRSPDLSLPTGAWSEASPLEQRIYNGSAFFFEMHKERLLPQIDWAAKNRYNVVSWQAHHEPGRIAKEIQQMADYGALQAIDDRGLMLHGPGHCFPFFLPTEKYFEAHPEWFGLHEGKRRKHGGEWPLMNYCWSNPEANAEFIRNAESFVRQWPQLRILYMVGIDGGQVCACERCQNRGGPDLIVDLFNQLSDRLADSAPAVRVETVIGYGPLEQPPLAAKPNGRWQGLYAHWGRNHRHSYGDPDYANKANLETWTALFKRYTVCSYYAAASHQPFNGPPFLHAIEGDTAYLIDRGATGHVVLQYPHDFWWNFSPNLAFAGLHAYYHPARGPRMQLLDYALTYFGPRAGPIIANYLAESGSDEHLETSYRASRGEATDADLRRLHEMRNTLQRAAQAVADKEPYAYRLSKLVDAMDMLQRVAPARGKVIAAEQALAEHQAGKLEVNEVHRAVADARAYLDELKAHAEQLNTPPRGTIDPAWLQSWTIHRTMIEPLNRIEKAITPATAPAPNSPAAPQ